MPVLHFNVQTGLRISCPSRLQVHRRAEIESWQVRVTGYEPRLKSRLSSHRAATHILSIVYYYWGRFINVTSQWHKLPRYSVETPRYSTVLRESAVGRLGCQRPPFTMKYCIRTLSYLLSHRYIIDHPSKHKSGNPGPRLPSSCCAFAEAVASIP